MVVVSIVASSRRQQGTDLPPILLLVLVGSAFHGVGLAAVAILVRVERRSWLKAFGLDQSPVRTLGLALASLMLVAPAVYALHAAAAAILRKFGVDPAPQSSVELLIQSGWGARLVIAFFAVVLAPVVEELLFRGLFFPLLRDAGLPRLAWLGTALLFGLIHGNAAAFLPLAVFGFFLAWLYERTGNLLAPVAAHAGFNLIPFILVALGFDLAP